MPQAGIDQPFAESAESTESETDDLAKPPRLDNFILTPVIDF